MSREIATQQTSGPFGGYGREGAREPRNGGRERRVPLFAVLLFLVLLVLFATFIIPNLNFNPIINFFRSLGYSPTSEISAIQTSLDLTSDANQLFLATRPSLDDNENFNYHCNSHDEKISILGCYTGGQMYIYDVNETSLTGIKEATTAHELLHAAWEQLKPAEQDALKPSLEKIYSESADLQEDLKIYSESERLDELHSRIGTQIADLPDDLEAHYAKYFKNQDAVVAFYTAYITPFNALSENIEKLSSDLSNLDAKIAEETTAYTEKLNALNQKVTAFNNCANTAGCFTQSEFTRKRAELIKEQQSLAAEYDQIDADVKTYNAKVDEYNQNVLRSNNLENEINSNSKPPTI